MADNKFTSFIVGYLNDCDEKGITSRNNIIDQVLSDIQETEQEIQEYHNSIVEKKELLKKYYSVLVMQGYSPHQGQTNTKESAVNFDETNEDVIEMSKKICILLAENGTMTNREIMDDLANGYSEEPKIYRTIKLLGEKQIITRDGSTENRLIPGENWENRPK